MLDRLNSVSVAADLPCFLTATLPDDVFCDDVAEFARRAKHWLDTFTKRLARVCPTASAFWRIEWQSRKSGLYEGKLVPHFHLLVWGLPARELMPAGVFYDERKDIYVRRDALVEFYVDCLDNQLALGMVGLLGSRPVPEVLDEGQHSLETSLGGKPLAFVGSKKFVGRCERLLFDVECSQLRSDKVTSPDRGRYMSFADWASLAWYNVVGSHNLDHLAAGVRVERVRTWGGVMSYCAKYMAKSDCGFLYEVQYGRSWGVFNRKSVPWAKMVELELDGEAGNRLRRIARHYLERRLGRRIKAPYGLTLYCDVKNFRRLWERPPPDPF
jgi:hypothetical protein